MWVLANWRSESHKGFLLRAHNCWRNPKLAIEAQITGTQDWHVLSKDAVWRSTVGNRSETPHKVDLEHVALLRVPGLTTQRVATDPMHTFHLGWGQDLAASGLVLLAKEGCFGQGALDRRLERAYAAFVVYCSANGKTTSCDRFSKQAFDMNLGPNQ